MKIKKIQETFFFKKDGYDICILNEGFEYSWTHHETERQRDWDGSLNITKSTTTASIFGYGHCNIGGGKNDTN